MDNAGRDQAIQELYTTVAAYYSKLQTRLGAWDHGFRILYGPVDNSSSTLIVGFQPGGDRSHHKPEEHLRAPLGNDYLEASWKLATELRQIFGMEFLAKSVGTNAVFFRSPNIAEWNKIDSRLRAEIGSFCRSKMQEMVETIKPTRIVVLGWDALEVLDAKGFSERSANRAGRPPGGRKRLLQVGRLFGTRTFAIPHPSAAWKFPPVTPQDWEHIATTITTSS